MPAFGLAALVPMLIKIAPVLVRESLKIYKGIKASLEVQSPKEIGHTENIHVLLERIVSAEERVETLEGHIESQAALVVKLTQQNQTLTRCVFALAAVLIASTGVAIAALMLTLWQ